MARKSPTREELVEATAWVTSEIGKELAKDSPNRGRILVLRLSLDEHLRRLNALLEREETR